MTYNLNIGVENDVNTLTSGSQLNASVTTLANGNYIVTWQGPTISGSGSYDIYFQQYSPSGQKLFPEVHYTNGSSSTVAETLPIITALSGGGFVIAWQATESSGVSTTNIVAQRFDAFGGQSGGTMAVNTYTTGTQVNPCVVGTADGGYIFVWDSTASGHSGVWAQKYDGGGGTVGSEFQVNTTAVSSHVQLGVAALDDGGYVVTYADSQKVFGQRYAWNNVKVGGEVLLNATAHSTLDVAITGLHDGGYVATWETATSGLFARQFDASGNAVTGDIQVNDATTPLDDLPSVAALRDGGYVIAWAAGPSISLSGIYIQVMDSSGNKVGPEMQVDGSGFASGDPDVAALADGGFVVTWHNNHGDAAGYGIEQRLYHGAASLDGAQSIFGSIENDNLDGGAGADTLYGGLGDDTYMVNSAGDTVVENAGGGFDTVVASVSYTLGTEVENLTLSGSAPLAGTGNDLDNVILGNYGANALQGQGGNDYIDGGSGNDDIHGGTGDDNLLGGVGNDTINGDDGDDYVDGGSGNDTINGGPGHDNLNGGAGADTITLGDDGGEAYGGTGNDSLTGGAGSDYIDGGSGNDSLVGGAGHDEIYGGDGSDVITLGDDGSDADGGTGNDTITGGAGNDNIDGGSGYDIITGGDGNDNLTGGDGVDTIDGGAGNDTVDGGSGNDFILMSQGLDDLDGGSGRNQLDVSHMTAGVTVDMTTGQATSGANMSVIDHFTSVDGTVYDDTLIGNAYGNTLWGEIGNDVIAGNGGDDLLSGGDGNDTLDGGNGNDTMYGGGGDDTYSVDAVGDIVSEQLTPGIDDGGTDLVLASISYTLGDFIENLTLTGSANINGTGNALANVVTGNTGNNVLDGGVGADTMMGGLGNDSYVVDNAGDIVTEAASAGSDTVLVAFTWALGANIENLTLTGGADANGTGNALDNVLTGNSGTNVLTGGLGNDTYVVQNTTDVVTELSNQGTDTVLSSVTYTLGKYLETLVLTGTSTISAGGNSTNNTLIGNDAANRLDGKGGDDLLTGGLGADTFTFTAASGHDTVSDFSVAQNDKINVNAYTLGVAYSHGVTIGQDGSGNAVIDFGGGNSVTILGVAPGDAGFLSHIVW